MRRLLVVGVLLVVQSAFGQALPSGHAASSRWLLDASVGAAPGNTDVLTSIGATMERPLGRLELDTSISANPGHKGPLRTWTAGASETGLFYVTPQLAVLGRLDFVKLWSSQFNKKAWQPYAGIALRNSLQGTPGRLEVAWLFPTGCQWGPSCPIQGSRLYGARIEQDWQVYRHLRMGIWFGLYHGLEQGNPESLVPRKGYITGEGGARFSFGGDGTI